MSDEKGMVVHEKGAVVHPSSDMQNAGLSATDVRQVPHMQAGLLEWCRAKLERTRQEHAELVEAQSIAIENGFKRKAFEKAEKDAGKRVEYYEKLVAAMEAGHCVFPTTDVTLFAVRTSRTHPDARPFTEGKWGGDQVSREVHAQALPGGEGKYVSDQPLVFFSRVKVQEKEGTEVKEVVRRRFYSRDLDPEIEFPLELAKPEILSAVGAAMKRQIFDELGVLPQTREADPVIVGRIIHPKTKKRVSFLLAWFVDTKEL